MNEGSTAMSQHASPQGHSTYVISTDKERFGSTQRHGWHRAWAWSWGVLSLITLLSTSPAWAQETVCARVKIEIKQELTLERQASEVGATTANAPSPLLRRSGTELAPEACCHGAGA
jgi:hypothetical protein